MDVRLQQAGLRIEPAFAPGDLGELIRLHGLQNFRDYGYDARHEAYVARIAGDFVIDGGGARGRAWLAKRDGRVVGSVLIVEAPDNRAQLRLLFVDEALRGLGLGTWLVREAVAYCRDAGFAAVFLWTVEGLDRAAAIYRACGLGVIERKAGEGWGAAVTELRYERAF